MTSSTSDRTPRLIGMAAATGGPQALAKILGELPPEFAAPILVVMSMRADFLRPFGAWLGDRCLLKVMIAEDGHMPEPGKVYLASGDPHIMVIEKGCIRLEPGGTNLQPKDALFRSMARGSGQGAIAVILTGMGRDGTEGMKEVRDSGGYTIAQDESTSMVYSMPRFAVEINAACESLPIEEITPRLLDLVAFGSPSPKLGVIP
jgi:two-component system, chemotaxis family, protein-glutamate methylesterase/glutaminase